MTAEILGRGEQVVVDGLSQRRMVRLTPESVRCQKTGGESRVM
jgi:hypothetical protein